MSESWHSALLHLSASVAHRSETVDPHGDVSATETIAGPFVAHAYQRWRGELVDGEMLGVEELVVHLMADVEITVGDRIDLTWPQGRGVAAEVIGPPARRVNARTGRVHHVECRTREMR